MNLGDLNKVWEIKTLKRKPKEEAAREILDRIAKQVQPIMHKHKWRVKVLSEFCPKNRALLGLNVGGGVHVKLRLRRSDNDDGFIPFHQVLDTMLHELCHNVHGPHNANFYKLWDEIRKECEVLINKGISGSGQGFDLPGRHLGGVSRKPPLHSLRQAALTAAENRARLGSLLPSGPKKIGGDSSIMASLSPVQAAAMAAERRLQDNIWCGSEFYDLTGEDEFSDNGCCSEISRTTYAQDMQVKPRKRGRESGDAFQSANGEKESTSVYSTETVPKYASGSCSDEMHPIKNRQKKLSAEASTSATMPGDDDLMRNTPCGSWQCTSCTLLNPPLAPICELCRTQRPKEDNLKYTIWSCKFCTLENDAKIDTCGVCGTWRYSYGPPVAAPAPNLGT